MPSFASTLDGILAASIAVKLDYTGLYGTGSAQPLGLRNASGVTEATMGTNGATPTDYDKFLDLIRDVQLQNGLPNTLIWSPRTVNTIAKIVTGITSDKTKLAPPPDVAALRKLVTNQISVTETQGSSNVASTVFIGGFETSDSSCGKPCRSKARGCPAPHSRKTKCSCGQSCAPMWRSSDRNCSAG